MNCEENFWCVYHNLLSDQSVYLKKAVEVTIDYQKSIYREVYSILEKKAVKSTSDFRYAVVSNEYFSNKFNPSYLSLQKISMTLLDIYKEVTRASSSYTKPLALCVLDAVQNKYVVIGVMGDSTSKNEFDSKNLFGNMFLNAARAAKVRSSSDYFESSIMEIHKDDFSNFIEALIDRR